MAVPQKDWEQPNSWIWLTEIDFVVKMLQTKTKILMISSQRLLYGGAKKPDEKKREEDKQTLVDWNSAHRRLQTKCQLNIQTSYIKQIKLFLFGI